MYLELDECCYSYASVPRNDTFCVPEGGQVNLNCIIVNPHDNFTDLTVTWFRSTTEDTSIFDEIPATSEEYRLISFVSERADTSLSVIYCSNHELYRDTFLLMIDSFTGQKNGYYWYQLSINNTLVQPSYRAYFSVGECNNTEFYYRPAKFDLNENKCAEYVAPESGTGLTTTYESTGTSSATSLRESTRSLSVTKQDVVIESDAESSIRLSLVTLQEKENNEQIIYVAGSFSALVLVFGALIIVLSILYLCKFQNRETSKPQLTINTSISGHI